jgi:hypothetical protein
VATCELCDGSPGEPGRPSGLQDMQAVNAQAPDPTLQNPPGRSGCLWVLAIIATVVSAIVSVLAISGVIELDTNRIDAPSSALILLSTPSWLEFLLFAAPTVALAGVVLLVRRRPGLAVGLIATCLALAAVACLSFVLGAGVQWGYCSLSCIASNADVEALIRAPRQVDDLMFDAALVSLAAIALSLGVAATTFVVGLRTAPGGESMPRDRDI